MASRAFRGVGRDSAFRCQREEKIFLLALQQPLAKSRHMAMVVRASRHGIKIALKKTHRTLRLPSHTALTAGTGRPMLRPSLGITERVAVTKGGWRPKDPGSQMLGTPETCGSAPVDQRPRRAGPAPTLIPWTCARRDFPLPKRTWEWVFTEPASPAMPTLLLRTETSFASSRRQLPWSRRACSCGTVRARWHSGP